MATEKQVQDAIARVKSGNAKGNDRDLVDARAKTAGIAGSGARAAQKEDGKDKSKSWGW